MYNNTIARARKDSQGQRRNCRMSAASQAPHIPRAMRIAERDAEYRQHQSPNRGSQTAQPASSDWHESKNMREGPPSSKESKSPRCNGQHSGCRRRRPMLPYMLPLRQPSLLLLLGWPPVRLVNKKPPRRRNRGTPFWLFPKWLLRWAAGELPFRTPALRVARCTQYLT
jgi:hypothetical protein